MAVPLAVINTKLRGKSLIHCISDVCTKNLLVDDGKYIQVDDGKYLLVDDSKYL